MKKILKGLTVIVLFVVACQPASDNVAQKSSASNSYAADTAKSMYAVSYKKAKREMDRYKKVTGKIFGPDSVVRAWTIRSVDLLEAMGMPVEHPIQAKYKYVRIYMGMKKDSTIKLFLTPVEGAKLSHHPPIAGKDVILSGPYDGVEDDEVGEGDGDYLLDFSSPCPTTCP